MLSSVTGGSRFLLHCSGLNKTERDCLTPAIFTRSTSRLTHCCKVDLLVIINSLRITDADDTYQRNEFGITSKINCYKIFCGSAGIGEMALGCRWSLGQAKFVKILLVQWLLGLHLRMRESKVFFYLFILGY